MNNDRRERASTEDYEAQAKALARIVVKFASGAAIHPVDFVDMLFWLYVRAQEVAVEGGYIEARAKQ